MNLNSISCYSQLNPGHVPRSSHLSMLIPIQNPGFRAGNIPDSEPGNPWIPSWKNSGSRDGKILDSEPFWVHFWDPFFPDSHKEFPKDGGATFQAHSQVFFWAFPRAGAAPGEFHGFQDLEPDPPLSISRGILGFIPNFFHPTFPASFTEYPGIILPNSHFFFFLLGSLSFIGTHGAASKPHPHSRDFPAKIPPWDTQGRFLR